MDKTVVIMAAGMGSRYGGLKQLDVIGPSGETIIDYSVFDALRAGFTKIVFVIRRDIEKEFKQAIGSRFSHRIAVRYVFQELEDLPEGFTRPTERTKPWGTGHAMLSASREVREPFLVINADDFYGADAYLRAARFLEDIRPDQVRAGLVGFLLKNTLSEHGSVARGICTADDAGILVDVEEILEIRRTPEGGFQAANREGLRDDDLVSMNMWAFSPGIFAFARQCFADFLRENRKEPKAEFYIPLFVNRLIQEESLAVQVLETDSAWFGVTYKEDKPGVIARIAGLIEENQYPADLWGGGR